MLQLQRASAGSGKTFTLAKNFIWFLIAVKASGNRWRLRTSREIADGLPRILAITFTNKATNEMKQRIVQKLSDLTKAFTEYPLPKTQIDSITYLNDFSRMLQVEYQEVGRAAKDALSVLLNNYSDFKVSTIDSFFQTVLRTFAYESNLNDTYQVEIDNDYIAAAAVNATLNEIDTSGGRTSPGFWLGILMEEESGKGSKNWNVFQKSLSDASIYTKLLSSVKRLESEDFKTPDNPDKEKTVREELDEYFNDSESTDPLKDAYQKAVGTIVKPANEKLARAKQCARKLKKLFEKNNIDPAEEALRFMAGHLQKLQVMKADDSTSKFFSPIKMEGKTSVFKTTGKAKKPVRTTPDDKEMLDLAIEMYDNYSSFLEIINSSDWLHWKVYAPQIPYLGLIGVTRAKMQEYLDDNNTIQLGETNSMLHRIIGDDDTPFIYERLGTRLNHFLIDEFQDTSRLQWDNLLPLLKESESRNEDNLIIGDAKQSIYRFRNADPTLITTAVPKAFPLRRDSGMAREENTNWRSDRTIVEFNNYFFFALMRRVAEQVDSVRDEIKASPTSSGSKAGDSVNFHDLYANVVQYPSHQTRSGYVEVNFLEAPESIPDLRGRLRKLSSEEKNEFIRKEALSRIGPLISSLLERGYRQSDIALLVRVNSLAKEVIDTLVAYNTTLPSDARHLEFISEESLLVSSSDAVKIIISVIEKMIDGTSSSSSDSSDDDKSEKKKWADIRCNFSFYALRHPELATADQVKGFLEEDSPTDAVNAMLGTMQTVALPALIEAITENFVPEDMRRSQAVFIAALQDMVLEYCDSHPADISSFIDWWKTKGVSRSISSPEGTDAIQIMTIHKSKGLEFKCVIIPFDDASVVPLKKNDWKWVTPQENFLRLGFPPYIPIPTEPALKNTVHADIYRRFFELSSMDMLNAYYVAFTRAVSELYVFTRKPAASSAGRGLTLGSCLNNFFTDDPDSIFGDKISEIVSEAGDIPEKDYMLPPGSAEWNDDHTRLTIGTPPAVKIPENASAQPATATRIISEYHVDSSPSVLQYVETDDTSATTLLPDAEDTDPRSEGNLLHSIMSAVKVPSDLHRALVQHKMRGLITSLQAKEWETLLAEAMTEPVARDWFDSSWRVINERDIIFPGMKNRRPDRMLIAPDKSCGVIVDYKFGDIPSGKAHIKQVEQYLDAFREVTHIHNVKGYVWYVRRGKIVEVLPS